jgi:hypothetical protein
MIHNIAIADFIFSNGLPMSLVECTKFHRLIQSARHIPPKYTPPYRKKMAGPLLDDIYQSTYDEQMRSLLKESKVFGIAFFWQWRHYPESTNDDFFGIQSKQPICIA